MLRRALALAALAHLVALGARAQAPHVSFRNAGPRAHADPVRRAIADPRTRVVGPEADFTLPRDSTVDGGLLVLGSDVRLSGTVRGNVVVVDGDLYLRPGGAIEGSVSVIGGCVYASMLARVTGERSCVRDATYAITPAEGGYALDWIPLTVTESSVVSFPLMYGFRLPEYTRVDGLVLPWGPRFTFDSGRVEVDPTATYHSDLGAVDAGLRVRSRLGGRGWMEAQGARATLSNDRWIRSDPINAIGTFVAGRDTRNYWRADRLTLQLGITPRRDRPESFLWIGGRTERDWSVAAGGPWSISGRTDTLEGILRPNPRVARGRISSALAGGALEGESTGPTPIAYALSAVVEQALDAPGDARFTQVTADAAVGFPTFGAQRLTMEVHAVATAGDQPPPQRFAYLGGSGTLPTTDLLFQGGDRLFYLDGRYIIPVERWRLPIVGPPTFTLRYAVGSAGLGRLPDFTQNLALRLALMPIRAEFAIDPATRDTHFAIGISLGR